MAYSNWGAFVYRNGERQRDREDVPVLGDADVEAAPSGARIWVSLFKARVAGVEPKEWERCHHAVLGNGRVRLCGYKAYPRLYLFNEDGTAETLELEKFARTPAPDWAWFDCEDGIAGELEGCRFSATPCSDPEAVELELIEPDGTRWTGKSGYCMGAGFEGGE